MGKTNGMQSFASGNALKFKVPSPPVARRLPARPMAIPPSGNGRLDAVLKLISNTNKTRLRRQRSSMQRCVTMFTMVVSAALAQRKANEIPADFIKNGKANDPIKKEQVTQPVKKIQFVRPIIKEQEKQKVAPAQATSQPEEEVEIIIIE